MGRPRGQFSPGSKKAVKQAYDYQYHLANLEQHHARNLNQKILFAGRPRPARCEICNRLPDGKGKGRLHFDHDNEHCKYGCDLCFRGWICHNCNVSLGMAEENLVILSKQIDYLRCWHASRLKTA
jgi:hypothetical protein